MQIERNPKLDLSELNDFLATNKWNVESLDKLENVIRLSWGWICVRDESGKLIGFVRVLSDGLRHAYICSMLVHPDYRKQGIGRMIMEGLMAMLKEHKLYPTLVANPGNKEFYEKFGFKTEIHGFTAMCIRDSH